MASLGATPDYPLPYPRLPACRVHQSPSATHMVIQTLRALARAFRSAHTSWILWLQSRRYDNGCNE